MIQVFLVDTGTMYQLDVNLQNPVSRLNDEITRVSRIPMEKQVLLISGGVPLFPDKPLCYYKAILDNPIYLICKSAVSDIYRPASMSFGEHDVTAQVEAAALLPAATETVRSRTQLAVRISHIDRNMLKAIEQLVFDQHLQQQGWAAVVANLDDLVSGFDKRFETFRKQVLEFRRSQQDIVSLVNRMPEVLILLTKIPVLPSLETVASLSSVSLKGPLPPLSASHSLSDLTLYTWMNAQDSRHKLEDVITNLKEGINQLGEEVDEKLGKEVEDVKKYASGPWPIDLKSIKGLEERLYGLDKLSKSAQTTVEAQVNMTKGFEQNLSRLEAVKDSSILPDLCASHRKQMKDMLVNHRKLLELKKKCTDAKKELSDNLQHRLRWVMDTHRLINGMDNKLVLYYDWVNRILARADFLRQVEHAPHVYASMVVEVSRRRLFSQHYMKWAKGVADESRKEYRKEMQRRKSFTKQFGSHFLQKLFVGFKDNIPKFANETPKDIDSQLPEITAADIENLAQSVPELRQHLRVPTATGSPALQSSFQHGMGGIGGAEGGLDALMLEASQSMASSAMSIVARSTTSTILTASDSASVARSPPNLDLDRLSLSYQGQAERAEGRPQGEDLLFLSLREKFPVPQCLSETLTAEVNSAAMSTISVSLMSASPKAHELSSALEELGHQQQQQQQQQQQDGGGGDGVLFSSGDLEPAKSSDSDAISHDSMSEHKLKRGKRRVVAGGARGLSDTSPEAETSQEFTTADFYIEDSMPSSITDSPKPTGASGKDVMEMDAALTEKTRKVGELEAEVGVLRSQLTSAEERIVSLRAFFTQKISGLKDKLGELKDSVRQGDLERVKVVLEVGQEAVQASSAVVERVEQEAAREVEAEKVSRQQEVEGLQGQLEEKDKVVSQLQQDMQKAVADHEETKREMEALRVEGQREVEALKERHAQEADEAWRKNLMEVELERENARAEAQQQLTDLESQVHSLQGQVKQAEVSLTQKDQENSDAVEKVTRHFQQLLDEERAGRQDKVAELAEMESALKAMELSRNDMQSEQEARLEAANKEVSEKDRMIEDLEGQLAQMKENVTKEEEEKKENADLKQELADIKDQDSQLKFENRRLEDEVSLLQSQLRQYSEQLQSMTASAAPVSPNLACEGAQSDPEGPLDLKDWEQIAILREQTIQQLEEKLMSSSMTTSVRKEIRDKVSILTCNVGDLVLLCLDERHDQYVVFTVGTTLHFLHGDCLEPLGLKSVEGEARKNWVLAEVTEREYCQAKKAQNRFKVPVNTKFYRVKAKPWSAASSSR